MRSTGVGIVGGGEVRLNVKTSSHCANHPYKIAPMIPTTIRKWSAWLALIWLGVGGSDAAETERVYLSGRGKDDAVPWRFMCTTGALSGFWTNIPVPSNWDVLGFGHLTYKKDYSNSIAECGLYEKEFTAPKKWRDKRVYLVFEGAMTDTTAKLNGQLVGPTHQGGFYRFKYDVTDKLKLGAENKLEVTVAKHSANESVNKAERLADYWVFGGIYRPVYLEVVPQQFIERVAIDARADGKFTMQVIARGLNDVTAVEMQILDQQGKPVPATEQSLKNLLLPPSANLDGTPSGVRLDFGLTVANPKQWTAETPNLYVAEIRVKRGSETIHRYTERFGFRTFEVRDGDGLYLNGQKIILKGVNRHSFWPDSGRCLSTAVHKLDITTIKEMNGNAVRMSHYPPDKEFLELCDELGLYVLNELAGWHNSYDTDIGTKLVEEMVTRDVNHPSILFWDNGNEGGSNPELDAVFHAFDPQKRRVLHPWGLHSGLNTAHYLAYTNAQLAAAGQPMYYHPKEQQELLNTNLPNGWIYMPTEFMHGLYDGGAGAGLADYWSMMMSHSNCAGGFIWVFADEGIKRPGGGDASLPGSATGASQLLRIDTAGNQAPDGIVGPYREREGSFYAIKEIWGNKANRAEAKKQWPVVMKPGVEVVGRVEGLDNGYAEIKKLSQRDVVARIETKTGALMAVEKEGKKFLLNGGPRLVMTNAVLTKVVWQIRKDGWLQCDFAYTATGTQDVFGVVFNYPENLVKKKRWLGDGPFRVWKNRLGGVTFGEWENDYNNTITGYSDWKYPEFKGCFSNVRWLQLETTEGLITVVPENIPFVQVLTPEQPPDNLIGKTKVNLPQCGLGFLHAIPPIGTKFKDAAASGPQSQPNVGQGEYSGRVSFYFGKLP
jgi:hypothetical protein